jgi:hypothetical protein
VRLLSDKCSANVRRLKHRGSVLGISWLMVGITKKEKGEGTQAGAAVQAAGFIPCSSQ